jgi:hypothetical protein
MVVQCICHRLAGIAKDNGIETDGEHSNSGFDGLSTAFWIGGQDGTPDNSDIVLGTCSEHPLIRFFDLGAVQHVHALTDRKAVVALRVNCHVNVWVGEDVFEICQRPDSRSWAPA